MNKQKLIEKLFEQGYFKTKADAESACEFVFNAIQEAVKNGEKVSIGGFGIFQKKITKARIARNPKTGESVQVEARAKVKFSIGKSFKDLIQ